MNRSSNRPGRQITDLLAILSLGVLICAGYWRIALAGRVLAEGDVFTYFYPYWSGATRAFQARRLPLWNPYLFMGAPFLANSQVGTFYPLNWPLWLLLPAHRSVHLTIVLHLCLAALNAYLWGRSSLRLGRIGAWAAGASFALGGYLGAQVEHVNQLQGLAWLPLMLLLYDRASKRVGESANRRGRAWALFGLIVVVGLVLLAGHTQTAFIALAGLALYGLGPALAEGIRRGEWKPPARRAALLAVAAGLGGMLAMAQLLPTWELSRLSVRAGGLPFKERVSFSLSPFYLGRALLPGYGEAVPPEHIEHVAYVGLAGLALAGVGLLATAAPQRARRPVSRSLSITLLVAVGLFLALGRFNPLYLLLARYVPGFAHFRAPARWLALYVLGMAGLAGGGADTLHRRVAHISLRGLLLFALALVLLGGWAALGVRLGEGARVSGLSIAGWTVGGISCLSLLALARRRPRPAMVGLLALLVAELLTAGVALPHGQATASQAFTGLRPAIAHLLVSGSAGGGRFLSMSDVTFDPGDLPEIERIYGPQLSADALYDYVIAVKKKEVLSPNLPLVFGVPAVDGYGGGLLPLRRYLTLQRLILPPSGDEPAALDGRLRERLIRIPDGRWLNLFNVQYVITDKLHDAWLDDVFYDLQFGAELGRGEDAAVAHVPPFEATALGLVSHLRGGGALAEGALVGAVEVGFDDGSVQRFELRAGEQTAEGLYGAEVTHSPATVGGHFWPGEPAGSDYVTRLRWREPAIPTTISLRASLPEGELIVRGVSLIDERTGSFHALVLSDRGRFRLAHSGDVKIYENLDALPRAFLVHEAAVVGDDEEALVTMEDPAFDPAQTVVLSAGEASRTAPAAGEESARVTDYAPERVEIEVEADSPGYLVLTDAWYPGWEATVDGEPTPIHRADVLFRAVSVDAGQHQVVFTLRPASLRTGAAVSLVGLIGSILLAGYRSGSSGENALDAPERA